MNERQKQRLEAAFQKLSETADSNEARDITDRAMRVAWREHLRILDRSRTYMSSRVVF